MKNTNSLKYEKQNEKSTPKNFKIRFFCTQMLNSLKVRFATIIDQERNKIGLVGKVV